MKQEVIRWWFFLAIRVLVQFIKNPNTKQRSNKRGDPTTGNGKQRRTALQILSHELTLPLEVSGGTNKVAVSVRNAPADWRTLPSLFSWRLLARRDQRWTPTMPRIRNVETDHTRGPIARLCWMDDQLFMQTSCSSASNDRMIFVLS